MESLCVFRAPLTVLCNVVPTELQWGNLTSAGVVVDTKECFYVHDGKSSLKKYVV
jgi:hypothetical protein